jgi:DNA-directed RNA polymerase specialized sigma24 family protein
VADLWELLRAVVESGDKAWPALAAALDPELSQMARRQPIGRLRDREDTPREVVTRALARLHAREFAAVKKLCAMDPPPELRAWLRVLVRRSAIDYMRESPEFERATPNRPNRWISLATLSSGAAAPGPDSLVEKRTQVLRFVREMVDRAEAEFAAHGLDEAIARLAIEWKVERVQVRRLVKHPQRYLAVLVAVLEGRTYPEIGDAMGISRREVELTVRYLEEILGARGFAT